MHAFLYGFIVKQACFLPWYSDSLLERSLTYSGLPKFPRFPSLSTVPSWDFYSCLCVLVVQSCPTLCNPPGSSVHRGLQARILEWVAIPFSRGSFRPRDRSQVSCAAGRFFTSEPLGKPGCLYNYPILSISTFPFNVSGSKIHRWSLKPR